MRSRILTAATVLLFASAPSFAGLVVFTPPLQFFGMSQTFTFDLTLEAQQLTSFSSVDMIITGDAPFQWSYSPEFIAKSGPLITPTPIGAFPIDLFVGGVAKTYGTSIRIGTITVDTTGLALGTLTFAVDSNVDGITNIGCSSGSEGLYGSGSIVVVPEPSSLLILLVSAIAAVRIRRGPR